MSTDAAQAHEVRIHVLHIYKTAVCMSLPDLDELGHGIHPSPLASPSPLAEAAEVQQLRMFRPNHRVTESCLTA